MRSSMSRNPSIERIQGTLQDLGFRDVELRMFGVRSNGYVHHFWLATAP